MGVLIHHVSSSQKSLLRMMKSITGLFIRLLVGILFASISQTDLRYLMVKYPLDIFSDHRQDSMDGLLTINP